MTILTNVRRRSIIAALSLLFGAALSADQGRHAPQTGAPGRTALRGSQGGRGGGLQVPEQTQALRT